MSVPATFASLFGPLMTALGPEAKAKLAEYSVQRTATEIMDMQQEAMMSLKKAEMAAQIEAIERERRNMKKPMFTVFEVNNGFVAEFPGSGLVIGATLSEVCSAAQAQAATQALLRDDVEDGEPSASNPLGLKKALWQKLNNP